MINNDPSSRRVVIKRKIVIGDYTQKDIEEMMGDSSRPIGAYWDRGTVKAGSGLTYEEQRILMPVILNCEATDRDFRTKCEEYFDAINTKVPKEGIELEIGLHDNTKPLSEINLPLYPVHYVAYRHALGHPQVAKSKGGAEGNQLIKWYIEDPDAELNREKQIIAIKDKAAQLYLLNKDVAKTVNMVLDLANVKTTEAKKALEFKKLSESKPVEFIRLIEDKDIKLRYLLSQAISQGVLKRIGTNIVWNESGTSLGATMEEVLVNLKDKANAPELNKIKASLKSPIETD